MIISIHVPKSGGTSFRRALSSEFKKRLMLDYGDWASFSSVAANARRHLRASEMWKRRGKIAENYDVIHGHFIADKYLGMFPHENFIAFFRDPYQQVLSSYYYLLRNPQINHPTVKHFHEAGMTIDEYLEWEATENPQTKFLGTLSLDSLALVCLTEAYSQSLAHFNARFGRALSCRSPANVNVRRHGQEYGMDPNVRKAVDRHRAKDIATYRMAKEIFSRQSAQLDI